jgi:hypothetical protein
VTLTVAEWTSFRALIDEPNEHKELECQPYLLHAAGLLLPGAHSSIVAVTEERNFFGRADFIIAADVLDGTNQTSRHAYIFELKAPQCHLFQTVTANRCQPTSDFLAAENQLLHYFDEAAGNGRFRERMGIIDQDNIHIGGIIIGTLGRLLSGGGNVPAARSALRVREKYLYKSEQMRVLTWDRISDYVRPV